MEMDRRCGNTRQDVLIPTVALTYYCDAFEGKSRVKSVGKKEENEFGNVQAHLVFLYVCSFGHIVCGQLAPGNCNEILLGAK